MGPHFDVVGLRFEPDAHWTRITQLLDGVTIAGSHAATIACLRDLRGHWEIGSERQRIHTSFDDREDIGLPPTIGETPALLMPRQRLRIRR